MGLILEENKKIFLGLYTALSRTRGSARNVYFKVLEGQVQYFSNHEFEIGEEQQEKTLKLLDDAMHKFYFGSYALEQLWGVQNHLKVAWFNEPKTFSSNLTNQQNEITFLLAAIFDQVLYSWRSFLDYYLKYLQFFLTGTYQITMSAKNFKDNMSKHIVKFPEDKKAIQIERYIREKVLSKTFGEKKSSWGDLLRSLRDKTAHQKLIIPTISKQPNNQNFLITWPTIQGKNYSELAQREFENNCFEMIIDFFPILYEFSWIAGPFKKGMFKKE